ncbi:hypothetical protein NX794_07800 [Streptomyces sp. LP11]|uniref:Secreted protein n=1 Tax=Streptomyces pyxinicus TaxID=2970331 RepID=A0ABT2AY13_9ACTN|nr:hypothetical protein [Streptomyces sp. LP11]MCS0601134.1 hypothetical protein [Streptomyces sp. LP11]
MSKHRARVIVRPIPRGAPFYVAAFALALLIVLLVASPAEASGTETPIVHHQKDITP